MDMNSLLQQYQRDGYVVVPNLLSAGELQTLRAITDEVSASAIGKTEDDSVFDFEDGSTPEAPQIQRIKKPHRVHPYFFDLARHPGILGFIQAVCGQGVRLSHSKMNMKAARVGSPLEWHQDWAFAPHTNMSTCVASVLLDDVSLENGAMQVLPGSHLGPLLEHHNERNNFVGAVDVVRDGLDLSQAQALTGPAGTVSFHHPMTLHGSGANRSGKPRRILFLEYAASDAFPLFYQVDWAEYNSRIVAGPETSAARCEPNPIKLPFPAEAGISIYKSQAQVSSRYFEKVA